MKKSISLFLFAFIILILPLTLAVNLDVLRKSYIFVVLKDKPRFVTMKSITKIFFIALVVVGFSSCQKEDFTPSGSGSDNSSGMREMGTVDDNLDNINSGKGDDSENGKGGRGEINSGKGNDSDNGKGGKGWINSGKGDDSDNGKGGKG